MILGSGNFQITGKSYLMQVARHGKVFHTPGTCQIAYKIIISGKLIFFYWQLLIILFAVDIAKKIWNYTSLCFEKGKIYFWRGNFRRGRASWRGAVMAFIPDPLESGTFRPQTISSPSRFAPKTFPPWSFPPWSFRPL